MSNCKSTPREVTVYALASTRDGAVRYIGQTNDMAARRRQHLSYAKLRRRTAVHKWINKEVEAGFEIIMAAVIEDALLHIAEVETIAKYRAMGCRLLNLTDGGEGTVGWRGNVGMKRPDLSARNQAQAGKPGRAITDEVKAKISAAKAGKKQPHVSERNRAMAGKPGHKHTDASRAKIGAANKGRTHSVEARQKIGAANTGRKLSEEAVMKLREAHRRYYEARRTA